MYDHTMVALGVQERTPNMAWQAAKATTKLHIGETCLPSGLGFPLVKFQVCVVYRSQTLFS